MSDRLREAALAVIDFCSALDGGLPLLSEYVRDRFGDRTLEEGVEMLITEEPDANVL